MQGGDNKIEKRYWGKGYWGGRRVYMSNGQRGKEINFGSIFLILIFFQFSFIVVKYTCTAH